MRRDRASSLHCAVRVDGHTLVQQVTVRVRAALHRRRLVAVEEREGG